MTVGAVVLEIPPHPNNPRNSEGAFLALRDGRLLFAYSRFAGGGGDDASAAIVARVSADGGRTWSAEDRPLIANEGAQNVMSVSFLRLRDDTPALFYLVKNGLHDCRLRLRLSPDEGQTWDAPRLVIPAPGYFVVNNDRIIRLRTGRLLAPAAFHRRKTETQTDFAGFDARGIFICFLSDDDGHTWRESRAWWALPLAHEMGLQEPGVVELRDGRLFAWCRTGVGAQFGLFSSDGGDTWTPPAPTAFRSPCSSLSLKRIPATGDLLAVWNDVSGRYPVPRPSVFNMGRTPLAAAISPDDGVTWGHCTLLEDDPERGFCYTALHCTEDRHVLLAYCAGGRATGGHVLSALRITRVPLSVLYA